MGRRKKDEAWQENEYLGRETDPKEAIFSLEASGVCGADESKVAPQSRATQDEHPAPLGQELSFR
ncbi:hypothetical protein [Pontibacter russatus]|uniref:hypothetical protein n=1 Tax=Pontibacter russatus TaxID=2694929 RepID=UPI00137A48B2|nr:hypothetical protein [Pontibacter russatus]